MPGDKIFVDTCVVIECLKGNLTLDKTNAYLNHIVLMELFVGAKNKQDLREIKAKLQGFKLLKVDHEIMVLATQIIERHALSHGTKIQDAIIAATCLINNLPLSTYNIRDFRYISDLRIVK